MIGHTILILSCMTILLILPVTHGQLDTTTTDSKTESSVTLPQEQQHNSQNIIMSVWAKKAGGNFKQELTQTSVLDEVNKDETVQESNDNDDARESETVQSQEAPEVAESVETTTIATGEDDYLYEDSEEEKECEEDQFWHIRGKRCVPQSCPGGNHWRDVNTGACILRYYGGGRRRYNRKSNSHRTFSGRIGGRWWQGK